MIAEQPHEGFLQGGANGTVVQVLGPHCEGGARFGTIDGSNPLMPKLRMSSTCLPSGWLAADGATFVSDVTGPPYSEVTTIRFFDARSSRLLKSPASY